jgi:hypothetical protein
MATTPFHNTVGLRGYHFEDFKFTFLAANGITANSVGLAVSLDTAVANTVKLAADNDQIFGVIDTFEDRTQSEGIKVVTVATRFNAELPIKANSNVVVGDVVVGAGNGEIKALANAAHFPNRVVEVASGKAVVLQH